MKKKIVGVTGATGFIGKNLVNRLLAEGYLVKTLVIEEKPKLPDEVEIVRGELVSGKGLRAFLKDVDSLAHLAARILPPDRKMFDENTRATYNLISEARKHPIKHIIFTSSVAVYGKGKKFRETDPCYPNTEYGFSKYLAEKIIESWSAVTGMPATILRPFNVYGPGNFKGIIYHFYSAIKTEGKVEIYSDGKQKRDFLYVDDAIELMSRAIKGRSSGVFNLGSGKSYSVIELLRKFEKVLNRKIPFTFNPAEIENVYNISPDVAKVERVLGWKAKTSLEEGLRKTISWYDKNL